MYIHRQTVCFWVYSYIFERKKGMVKISLSDDQCHRLISSPATYFFLSILHEVCWKSYQISDALNLVAIVGTKSCSLPLYMKEK